jgi:TonB family protein
MTALKGELRALISETVEAQVNSELTPNAFSEQLIKRIEDQDVPVGDTFSGYGSIQTIEFQRAKEYPDWLIAKTALSIPYGGDISLYVFQRRNSRWKRVMTVEANGYKQISDAQGFMEYRVLRTSSGAPYLITTEISPAAASMWQRLRLRILRPGSRPEVPHVVVRKDLAYCLDQDHYFSMRKNGFGLIYLGGVKDPDLAGYRRVHYLDATLDKDEAVIRGKATDPSNLINQWISEPWNKASHRVRSPRLRDVENWHERFRKENWTCDPGGIVLYERSNQLFATSVCATGEQSTKAFVLITPTAIGFFISDISTERPTDDELGEITYSDSAEGITPPVVESSVQPKLPEGQTAPARLKVEITIDKKGAVSSAGILDWPSERVGIAVAALKAVREWKFLPAQLNGNQVRVSTDVDIVFQP